MSKQTMIDTLDLLLELIKKESISPYDAGCQDIIARHLTPFGFKVQRLDFADTQNIWLRRGTQKPLLTFLGHTDVVPPGPLEQWDSPPFVPTIRNGNLYGRGAADMKGGIACFITAIARFIARHPNHQGSIAVLLTSDEEAVATHGTVKVIEVLEKRHEKIDWCLVGEPCSNKAVGDSIRVGRRGSLCADLTIYGVQGHIAYPDIAYNPIHYFAPALKALTEEVWDKGNAFFPQSCLQVSNIHSGTGADNVIPDKLHAQFNVRFNTELDAQTIKQRIVNILDKHQLKHSIQWRLSGVPFLTTKGELLNATHTAIKQVTGITPTNDTRGGTSDGRFIAPTGAQVIELGHVNASIHKINEHIKITDLTVLSRIYEALLTTLLV